MRTIVVVLFLFLTAISSTVARNEERVYTTYSAYTMVNPPQSYGQWGFLGNQSVNVRLRNGNVLGLIGSIRLMDIVGRQRFFVLPPMFSREEIYTMFGEAPIHWQFEINIVSEVALLCCYAHWASIMPWREKVAR